jgi:hypothetical protein
MSKVAEVTSVTVAEVWVDGDLYWTNAYANTTKKQAIAYAQNSAAARAFLAKGVAVQLVAKKFLPSSDGEKVTAYLSAVE